MKHVRTSQSDPIDVGWLDLGDGGCVGLTIAPGKKGPSMSGAPWDRDLAIDLDRLTREHQVGVLVCLLQEQELVRLGIPTLEADARARGLTVYRLPIPDGGTPEDLEAVHRLVDAILAEVSSGRRVVVHCAGGLGRSGTIGGCYLVRRGHSPDEALRALVAARGQSCPENDPQRRFIRQFAVPPAESAYEDALRGVVAVDSVAVAMGSAGRRSREDVARVLAAVERDVSASPQACFRVGADGTTTLHAGGQSYHAGTFTVPTLAELRRRLERRDAPRGPLRFSVLTGEHALTDIGVLQASAEPGVLFQVASQFNCLEAPSARIVPVQDYVHDPTQGPRASVSAFPGTFLRHYRAPGDDGDVFTQTEARHINLLDRALDAAAASVRHGYLQTTAIRDVPALARLLEDRFDQIRVGVHDDVEVVFGNNWGGPVPRAPRHRVAQVFTSTIALGGYGQDDGSAALATVRRQLLRGGYLGTLLAALDLGKHSVVLTCIGGGVFGNPHRDIWEAILWALGEAQPLGQPLHVILNGRGLDGSVPRSEIREAVTARAGVLAGKR